MVLTDKKAVAMLKKARLYDVEEALDEFPEDEREGRNDFQMLADEAGYIYSMYGEDTTYTEELQWARMVLRDTEYGKVIPVDMQFRPLYRANEVQLAKNYVNEYNRLVRFCKRLEKMGYYSQW